MELPYEEPLTVKKQRPRVIPEPPRRGEPGGEPCGLYKGGAAGAVWGDEHFTLHPAVGGSMPGHLWLASREHVDSFSDLSPEAAQAFGPLVARIERAILAEGDVGRVHVIVGATAARTSTSGSCRARSGCSRRRTSCCPSGRTCCRT